MLSTATSVLPWSFYTPHPSPAPQGTLPKHVHVKESICTVSVDFEVNQSVSCPISISHQSLVAIRFDVLTACIISQGSCVGFLCYLVQNVCRFLFEWKSIRTFWSVTQPWVHNNLFIQPPFFCFLFSLLFLCHFKVVGVFFHTVVIWTVLPRKLAFTPKRQIYASFYFMCGSTGTF